MTGRQVPSVLFVCSRNRGKSPMAAALMRSIAGDRIEVHSAGTKASDDPAATLNAEAVESLAEIGVDMTGEHPKPIDPALLARVDRVVVLGTEAHLEDAGPHVTTWVTDEPSERGITGMERMRLVREDIAARVQDLYDELVGTTAGPSTTPPSTDPTDA